MNSYRVLAGLHYEPDGKEYKKGDIVKTTRNLVEIYPLKFELCIPGSPSLPLVDQNPNGTDVTDLFPEAEEADAKVFKKDGAYLVFDKEKPLAPLNDKPFVKPADVRKLVRSLVKA